MLQDLQQPQLIDRIDHHQGLFCGKFSPLGDQKKRLTNPMKGFFRIFKKSSPYLEKKKLEVARFKQCVPLGHQN